MHRLDRSHKSEGATRLGNGNVRRFLFSVYEQLQQRTTVVSSKTNKQTSENPCNVVELGVEIQSAGIGG